MSDGPMGSLSLSLFLSLVRLLESSRRDRDRLFFRLSSGETFEAQISAGIKDRRERNITRLGFQERLSLMLSRAACGK